MPTPIVNLQDHERAAQAVLSASAWAYFSGGAADEITLRRNLSGWQQWGLAPRVLQDLCGGHTRCTLLGKTWPVPLLVAPMAFQRWAHALLRQQPVILHDPHQMSRDFTCLVRLAIFLSIRRGGRRTGRRAWRGGRG